MGLIDPSLASGTAYYAYSVDTADGQSFTATALHPDSPRCFGTITIDQAGRVDSQVYYATSSGNTPMTPSMEPGS